MKSIQRSIVISMVPFLTPLIAFAETDARTEPASPISGTKGSAASWRASQVMGLNVKNATDETIGEVKDLVLDMKAGEVLAVIISSGGFLGMADTLSAVPVSALRYDDAAKAFKTKLTKEQLGKAPQFKTDAWPDYGDAASTAALRSYSVLVGGGLDASDTTGQNGGKMVRDSAIPTDQGNSAKDVQITKDIRSGIMDTDMSFNAKNIKIITRDEQVTLKGAVDSKTEHQAILKIAGNHSNAGRITDELTVNSK